MHPPIRTLPLLLALSAVPAVAAEGPGEDDTRSRTTYEWAVRAAGGYFDGMGVRTDSGGLAILELDLKPKLQLGAWMVEVPLRLDHRQTFGADLNETIAGAALEATRKSSPTLRYGPLAGVEYTHRPGWPDLYQRDDATGNLAPTDRYSNLDLHAGWQHWYRLGDRRNLRWKVRAHYTDFKDDPGFDDQDPSPTHLVPQDNVRVRFDSSYRATRGFVRYGVGLDAWYRWDLELVAREANTGIATEDHLRRWAIEPSAEIGLRLAAVDVSFEYAFTHHVDAVTGYYSYANHHPSMKVEVQASKRLALTALADAWLTRYGPDSRDATEDGARLESNRYALKGVVRYALTKTLAALAEVEGKWRDTNYPDYTAPGPVIDWDYTNVAATAGVEWRP